MLLEFSVTNHRSIRNKMTLSLAATPDRTFQEAILSPDGKKQILPVMALYGPNAAGKSNVLHALALMKEMVAGKYAKPLKDAPLPQEPFAFTDESYYLRRERHRAPVFQQIQVPEQQQINQYHHFNG